MKSGVFRFPSHSFSLIFLITLLLWQCKTSQSSKVDDFAFKCSSPVDVVPITNDCQPDYNCTLECKTASAIEVSTHQSTINRLSVVRGKQLVFIMERKYKDHPAIADDEFAESIHFSIDPKVKSFSFDQSDLIRSGLTYGIFAYSRDRGYHVIENGCLEGYRANDGWHVQLYFDQILRTGNSIKKSVVAHFKYAQ
jgi:hypothetical protein